MPTATDTLTPLECWDAMDETWPGADITWIVLRVMDGWDNECIIKNIAFAADPSGEWMTLVHAGMNHIRNIYKMVLP